MGRLDAYLVYYRDRRIKHAGLAQSSGVPAQAWIHLGGPRNRPHSPAFIFLPVFARVVFRASMAIELFEQRAPA